MSGLVDDRHFADRVEHPNELRPAGQVLAGLPFQFGGRIILAANLDMVA